jgi:xanthine dehydrogenase accessory factor
VTETVQQLEVLVSEARRVAMATLVATKGTGPKKEGAKMWVDDRGDILGSVTIGGCVDARVIEESEAVLAGSGRKLLSMSLGDEDAWELGLTCGGVVDVLIEAIDFARPDSSAVRAYREVQDALGRGLRAVAVMRLEGSPERLVVREDGSVSGTLGDAGLDEAARVQALRVLGDGGSRTSTLALPGGDVALFFEVHAPRSALYVFGAGHLAIPLVELARTLGMRTVVVDGRERFATRERFPGVDELRVGIPSEIAGSLSYDAGTAVVLVAHDYKYDIPVLETVLRTGAGYIGLLGSTRRGEAIREFLREQGISDAQLARIHVPVGLDIGARTASEIALSILAEAIAQRSGRPGTPMRARRSG